MRKIFCLILYYSFARYLFKSSTPILGPICKKIRYNLCKHIFKKCGKNVNVEHGAYFGNGLQLEIGDNSGIGVDAEVPNNIIIGNNVLMGPNCYILRQNHNFSRIDIPIIEQGYTLQERTIIEDDVWIGRNVTMTLNRHIQIGTIIGACCLLCKDFPSYSVVGGNPSRLIKSRKNNENIYINNK